ncbi:MAG: hypothetical protein P4M15_08120 [Alphaproteobacteria bacterium]|nr:hypothetical protein [Alphaproteobacteria bacterium]
MKSMAKIPLWIWAFGLIPLLAPLLTPGAARADEPFAIETGHWMSFDHYKDADKRGTLDKINPPPAPEPVAAPVEPVKPTVAAPVRPIDLPVMPGLNKGFEMQVNSTEDETRLSAALKAANSAAPDSPVSDKNWQDPGSVYHTKSDQKNGDDDTPPLDVRLSYLPNDKITPVPDADHISAHHLARQALEKGLTSTRPEEKAPVAAACAAITAYKKQQLDAIQSDQQTLKALQDAIASLGLQKQLGFMTNGGGSLNLNGAQSSAKMDMPAAAPTVR